MKKSMASAYTDMMNNLAKSTAAVPLHLQRASSALAWWESPDSLLAKASVGDEGSDDLQKASVADKMRGLRQEGRNFEAPTAKELVDTLGTGDAAVSHASYVKAAKGAVKTNKKQKATSTGAEKAAADHNHEWNQGRYEGLRDNPVQKALAELNDVASMLLKSSADHEPDEAPATKTQPHYNRAAVDAAINSSNRAGRKISKKGASMIHRLLQGGHEDVAKSLEESQSEADRAVLHQAVADLRYLAKASAEHETDEAYEEDEGHDDANHDMRPAGNAENDVHGGDAPAVETDEGDEDEGDADAEEGDEKGDEMAKAISGLRALASRVGH